ncbi:MAG: hypothetical protein CML68_18905 [Rhodobacteraceae bacterium]|nr:hypothetical protein [Paracoccaceae bacterium]
MIIRSEELEIAGTPVRLDLDDAPTDGVRALLDGTVWGTRGGLRYRNFSSAWERLDAPLILSAHGPDGAVLGALVTGWFDWGYYIASIAVAAGQQRKGLGLEMCRIAAQWGLAEVGQGTDYAALVVGDNTAALQTAFNYGIAEQARVEALFVTRMRPTRADGCRVMTEADRPQVLAALQALGRGWQDADRTMVTGETHVCERDGRIVAGAQVVAQRMRVISLGAGLADPVLLWGLPRMLGVRADDFRYVQLFHVWGDRAALEPLIRHVLADHGVRMACIQLDPMDPVYPVLRQQIPPGLVARLTGVDSMAIFATCPIQRPMSVSPLMGSFC